MPDDHRNDQQHRDDAENPPDVLLYPLGAVVAERLGVVAAVARHGEIVTGFFELLLLQKRAPDADVGKVIVAVALHDLAPSVGGSGVFARVVLLGRLVDQLAVFCRGQHGHAAVLTVQHQQVIALMLQSDGIQEVSVHVAHTAERPEQVALLVVGEDAVVRLVHDGIDVVVQHGHIHELRGAGVGDVRVAARPLEVADDVARAVFNQDVRADGIQAADGFRRAGCQLVGIEGLRGDEEEAFRIQRNVVVFRRNEGCLLRALFLRGEQPPHQLVPCVLHFARADEAGERAVRLVLHEASVDVLREAEDASGRVADEFRRQKRHRLVEGRVRRAGEDAQQIQIPVCFQDAVVVRVGDEQCAVCHDEHILRGGERIRGDVAGNFGNHAGQREVFAVAGDLQNAVVARIDDVNVIAGDGQPARGAHRRFQPKGDAGQHGAGAVGIRRLAFVAPVIVGVGVIVVKAVCGARDHPAAERGEEGERNQTGAETGNHAVHRRPPLLIFQTGCRHCFENLALAEDENQYRHSHDDDRNCRRLPRAGNAARLNLLERVDERLLRLGVDDGGRLGVPEVLDGEDDERQPRGLDVGHDNRPENAEFLCTVDFRGLNQRHGQPFHELLHQEQPNRRGERGQDDRPVRIDKVQARHGQVVRYRGDVAVEHQRRHDKGEKLLAEREIVLRQHIRREGRNQQMPQCTHEGDDDGVGDVAREGNPALPHRDEKVREVVDGGVAREERRREAEQLIQRFQRGRNGEHQRKRHCTRDEEQQQPHQKVAHAGAVRLLVAHVRLLRQLQYLLRQLNRRAVRSDWTFVAADIDGTHVPILLRAL